MKGTSNIDQVKKVFRINLEGFANAEDTTVAVDKLVEQLKNFPVQDWSIVIDCRKLSTFKPDILPILERCYKDIYEKFKKAVLINPEGSVATMQLQRVARQTNFTGSFVTDDAELENILSA